MRVERHHQRTIFARPPAQTARTSLVWPLLFGLAALLAVWAVWAVWFFAPGYVLPIVVVGS
jgi:hypothetical protein